MKSLKIILPQILRFFRVAYDISVKIYKPSVKSKWQFGKAVTCQSGVCDTSKPNQMHVLGALGGPKAWKSQNCGNFAKSKAILNFWRKEWQKFTQKTAYFW